MDIEDSTRGPEGLLTSHIPQSKDDYRLGLRNATVQLHPFACYWRSGEVFALSVAFSQKIWTAM